MTWAGRLSAADPGLARLWLGMLGTVTAAAALGAEALLVWGTGALRVPYPHGDVPARVLAGMAAQHHLVLVLAMLVGAVFAMLSTIAVTSTDPRRQVLGTVAGGIVLTGSLAAGLGLASHRLGSMALLVAALAVGTYARRFGPDWLLAGLCLFVGSVFGAALYGPLRVHDAGWLAAEIAVAVGAVLCVRLLLFRHHPGRALRRARGSYAACARQVAQSALDGLGDPGRGERRLRRRLARLNETALMIDARLADPRSLSPGVSARSVHEALFDGEAALAAAAWHARTLAVHDLPPAQRSAVAGALLALRDGSLAAARAQAGLLAREADANRARSAPGEEDGPVVRALLRQFAGAVITFADSLAGRPSREAGQNGGEAFRAPVQLPGERLSGTAVPAAKASPGKAYLGRFRLRLTTRSAIQITVAGILAIAAGDALSGTHYYWAVLAVFVTFMGTNSSREQSYKAFYRAAGTLAGVAAGLGIGHALGDSHTAVLILVVLAALFVTAYFIQVNYGIAMVGITLAICELYVQLGEFSNSLLLTRLEVTAVGAGAAALVALTLIPLRPRAVLNAALRDYLLAFHNVIRHAGARALGEAADGPPRSHARRLDAAGHALRASAAPFAPDALLPWGTGRRLAEAAAMAAASRHHWHDLIAGAGQAPLPDGDAGRAFAEGQRVLGSSVSALADALGSGKQAAYVRSAAHFGRAERLLRPHPDAAAASHLAASLALTDGDLARLAQAAGLDVRDDGQASQARAAPRQDQAQP